MLRQKQAKSGLETERLSLRYLLTMLTFQNRSLVIQ